MKKNQLLTSCAVLAGFSLAPSYVAYAGWSGQMNGTGFGRATANVTSATGGLAAPTVTTTGPSAAVNNPLGTNFKAVSGLPNGSSAGTTSQITGSAGYVWRAVTTAMGGDKTDNEAVESSMNVVPQAVTKLEIGTDFDPDDRTITFSGQASGGTGLLVRIYNTNPNTTTFSTLSFDDGPTIPDFSQLTPIFSQSVLGDGLVDPISGQAPAFRPFNFTLPSGDENVWVLIDGFATSAVPDSGAFMGLAFGLTAAGLAMARRHCTV